LTLPSITSTVRLAVKVGLPVIESDVFGYEVRLEMREEGV